MQLTRWQVCTQPVTAGIDKDWASASSAQEQHAADQVAGGHTDFITAGFVKDWASASSAQEQHAADQVAGGHTSCHSCFCV